MRQLRATTEPCPPALLPLLASPRAQIEALVEALIAHLDTLDGDPDSEPEPEYVAEPWLRDGLGGEPEDEEPDNEDCCPAEDDRGTRCGNATIITLYPERIAPC